jgi:hypothetical protein
MWIAEAKVRAAQKELHRKRAMERAGDVSKKHVELAKTRLLQRGLTPPAHGLEERNGFATCSSHDASPSAVPGPGAYQTQLHKSIGRGVCRDNNEGETAPAYSMVSRRN